MATMANMSVRERVIEVVKRTAEALQASRTHADDTQAAADALRAACDSVGISPQDFDGAIASDTDLQMLKETAIREAVAGSTDPGPHGAVSRESMSGKPGDLTKSRTNQTP